MLMPYHLISRLILTFHKEKHVNEGLRGVSIYIEYIFVLHSMALAMACLRKEGVVGRACLCEWTADVTAPPSHASYLSGYFHMPHICPDIYHYRTIGKSKVQIKISMMARNDGMQGS